MKETIIWEDASKINVLAARNGPHLVKGFTIKDGSRRGELRLAWFSSTGFEDCQDMIIEKFAALSW